MLVLVKRIRKIRKKISKLNKILSKQKYMVPQHMSLSEWREYKKKHPDIKGPADYHKKYPNTKWKIVHGNKKGSVGKPLKGMTNMTYEEARKAHAAIMISKGA